MGTELRELKVSKGAAVILSPSALAGCREIEVEDGGLLIARGLSNEQTLEALRIWKGETA